jgi:hypothetical protein
MRPPQILCVRSALTSGPRMILNSPIIFPPPILGPFFSGHRLSRFNRGWCWPPASLFLCLLLPVKPTSPPFLVHPPTQDNDQTAVTTLRAVDREKKRITSGKHSGLQFGFFSSRRVCLPPFWFPIHPPSSPQLPSLYASSRTATPCPPPALPGLLCRAPVLCYISVL